jgi:hypothetical protein
VTDMTIAGAGPQALVAFVRNGTESLRNECIHRQMEGDIPPRK